MTTPFHVPAFSEILSGLIPERLARQLAFVLEIDRLKAVFRKTTLTDGSRRESSAEHSWQLALMALVLAEYASKHGSEEIDPLRVVTMLLVHDLVEIDAGDAFAFDAAANHGKEEREQAAAERVFGLLPEDQAETFRAAWEEFEARETAESRFANALDRLQPLLHNYATRGGTWTEFGITSEKIFWRMAPIKDGAPELHEVVEKVVEIALREGWIQKG